MRIRGNSSGFFEEHRNIPAETTCPAPLIQHPNKRKVEGTMNHRDLYVVTGRRASIGEYVCDDESPNRAALALLAAAIGLGITIAGFAWKKFAPSTEAKINRRLRVIEKQHDAWQKAA
jgi:hypothetical protein